MSLKEASKWDSIPRAYGSHLLTPGLLRSEATRSGETSRYAPPAFCDRVPQAGVAEMRG